MTWKSTNATVSMSIMLFFSEGEGRSFSHTSRFTNSIGNVGLDAIAFCHRPDREYEDDDIVMTQWTNRDLDSD